MTRPRAAVTAVLWTAVGWLASSSPRLAAQAPEAPAALSVRAHAGYAHPDPRRMRRARDGSVRWPALGDELRYYARFRHAGPLVVEVVTRRDGGGSNRVGGDAAPFALAVAAQRGGAEAVASAPRLLRTDADRDTWRVDVTLAEPGYQRLTVRPLAAASGPTAIERLDLSGPAAVDAHASTVERRNAASVHLGYPVDTAVRDEVAWFHTALTPRTDPLWSYYMATGWHRGYFGIQVNSPTERRVIFSVWDSGDEPVDRDKVAAEDRVQLLAKGDGVHASGFGNEGTGGHSHLVFPWRLGDTFEFLVHAEPVRRDTESESRSTATATVYTGYFRIRGESSWRLIASFRAPKDGGRLRGLYSFNENFVGTNGDRRRVCEFHDQWIGTTDDRWLELTRARFTHDGHGRAQRLDRSGGVRGTRFHLANGGFVDDPSPGAVNDYGATLDRATGDTSRPPFADALPSR